MLTDYLAHIIFFAVFFAAAIPVLYYIQRRNPHPHFRPGFGEMALLTLFAVAICGAMAIGLGTLFKPENDGKSLSRKPSVDIPGAVGGSSTGPGSGKRSGDRDKGRDGDEAPRRLNDKN